MGEMVRGWTLATAIAVVGLPLAGLAEEGADEVFQD